MVFELGNRDKLIDIHRRFGQHIFLKHETIARHGDRLIGWFGAVGKVHLVVAQHLSKGQCIFKLGPVHHIGANIATNQVGVGAFPQQAEKGARHLFANQLLQLPFKIDAIVRLFVLVEFETNTFGFADTLPCFRHRRSGAHQGVVNLLFGGAVITLYGLYLWSHSGSGVSRHKHGSSSSEIVRLWGSETVRQ